MGYSSREATDSLHFLGLKLFRFSEGILWDYHFPIAVEGWAVAMWQGAVHGTLLNALAFLGSIGRVCAEEKRGVKRKVRDAWEGLAR
jgi:hypothetical protein